MIGYDVIEFVIVIHGMFNSIINNTQTYISNDGGHIEEWGT